MVQDAAVIHNDFGFLLVEHFCERGVELLLGEPTHKVVVSTEVVIFFCNAHDDKIAPIHRVNEVPKVAVSHSRHSNPQGSFVCLSHYQ